MTNTNTLAPTDAEILDAAEDFRSQYMHGGVTFYEFDGIGYTRAVLAKWGAPAPASQPFAYEFSRSNGDGTHSEHIERGRLQEVAPGRWEHSGLPRGALADKPIKALYTTPQTQPAAVPAGMEPVAHVSQETFNDDGTSDIIIPALPIGMALYAAPQPAAQAGEYPAGTGNPEADRIIGRLASSDPDFDDCADAVALIHKLVAEIKGPDGFDTWKDAAIADRAASSVYSRSMDLVRVFWQQHTQADALSMTMAELHADVELVIRAARGAAQAALKHPAVKPDMLVNGGALKLALNVLRRAGKNEVADELECTAQAAPSNGELAAPAQPVAWALQWPEDSRLNISTVFDTQLEATDYLKSCSDGVVVVPLYAAPQQAAHLAAKWQLVPRQLTQDMAEAAKFVDGRLSVFKYAASYRAMLYAAPHPAAQAAPVDAAKLPSPANVDTAPKCLNLNDQAMWVLGWNECLDAARAQEQQP